MSGWECPVCHRVWAPYVAECPGPHVTFSTSTNSNTAPRGGPMSLTSEQLAKFEDVDPYRDAGAACTAIDTLVGEVRRLERWKGEALEVAALWEQVWVELGQPGPLGASKAAASLAAIRDIRTGLGDLRDDLTTLLEMHGPGA